MNILTGLWLCTITCALLLFPEVLLSADANFFSGKTIRIVIGTSPGGGFDVYSRTLARHMGKYIAGNPSFLVENMPGAGHRIAANHVYKIARPDGLTIGNFFGGLTGRPSFGIFGNRIRCGQIRVHRRSSERQSRVRAYQEQAG